MSQKIQKKMKNHWVAQAYLKAFSVDPTQPKEKRRIWRFSKISGDPELKRIMKVAYRNYLYTPGPAGGRDYTFEDKLGELDELYADSLWSQIANDLVNLCDDSIRKLIALQMAVMYLRNPVELDLHKSVHQQLKEFLNQGQGLPTTFTAQGKVYELDPSTWPAFRDASDDDIKRDWLKRIRAATEIAEIFMNMRWSVVVSDTQVFITTDNPVTFVHASLELRSIKNKGTLILFPLSPTRVLLLDHKNYEPDGQYYSLWKGGAPAINGLLWRNASEHMFSAFDPDIVCSEMVQFADKRQNSYGLYRSFKEIVLKCLSVLGLKLIYFRSKKKQDIQL